MGRLNDLAVPFLDEKDAEDDYALLPPPKPLRSLQLMGIAFFAVSGSAYGIEESVAVGGPFLALLLLLLAPVLWSAPMLMVASELSVALPQSGGYVIWIHKAFGALPSLLNAMSNLLCNVLDCAVYPLLLTEYLQRVVPALRAADGAGDAADLSAWLLAALVRLALIALAAGLNIAGVNLVGAAAGGLMLLVTLPFVALSAAAFASGEARPAVWFDADPALWPADRASGYLLLTLVLWNTCGYDSAGMVAAEVADAPRTFPRALWGALGLTTALYVLPLAACAAASPDTREWREGQFALLGERFGGGALEGAITAAVVVSMVGVLCTLLCTTSRALQAMAALRMLPAGLAQLHPTLGTPARALVVNALMVACASAALRLTLLVELSMFFYALNALMQMGALLRLRASHPALPRPERRLGARWLLPPAGLALAVLLAAPAAHWAAALALLGATLAVYAALSAARRTARRAAARRTPVGLLAVAAADDEADAFDAQLRRELRLAPAGAGHSHIRLRADDAAAADDDEHAGWWPLPLLRRAALAQAADVDRTSAAEIVSAFEVDAAEEQEAPPPAPAPAPPPARHSVHAMRALRAAPAEGEVEMHAACALADSLFAARGGAPVCELSEVAGHGETEKI